MSYILEALRKADAERGRGSVPDLHAQVPHAAAAPAEPEPSRSPVWLWLGLGALLALAAGTAWWTLGRDDRAALAPPAMAASVPPPLVAQPPVSAAPVPPPEAAAPPAPKLAARPKPSAAASAPARTARTAPAPKAVAAKPKAKPPTRLPLLAELPGELRQQVPALAVGGSVYSPQASARMVVINGQVFQEGSSVAPELTLEQIRPKTAVLSIRGQRFELPL